MTGLSERLFFFIYRFLGWPLLRGVFVIFGQFNVKIRKGLELRESVDGRAPWIKSLPPSPPTLWIHCASGEFEYAKPVIDRLKSRVPETKIVVTYFSPTYADNIRKYKGVDWVVPLPWDTPRHLNEFMDSYRPMALLIARTDVWPEMARQARKRGLVSILFSATLTNDSSRTKGPARWATRATLNQLGSVFCVGVEDAAVFKSLNLTDVLIETKGDTRFDQAIARLQTPKTIREDIFSGLSGRDIFVCGSTWPEDEKVLIEALRLVGPKIVGCIVPHEPTPLHLKELEGQLLAARLKPVRYSDPQAAEKLESENACLIVDQVGILAELYLRGRWAFVGGSFRKTVHSVMEPLAAGCVTFVGPLHTNNREALLFKTLKIRGGGSDSYVSVVHSSAELSDALTRLSALSDLKLEIKDCVRAQAGSSDRVVDWVLKRLQADVS